ncbi:MAG: hypothetical protein ACI31X_01885, partial [Lactobacillus amylovorus]
VTYSKVIIPPTDEHHDSKLLNTEQRRREGKLEEENVDKGTFLQSFLNEPKPLESMTDVELNHYQDMLLAKIADPEHNIRIE